MTFPGVVYHRKTRAVVAGGGRGAQGLLLGPCGSPSVTWRNHTLGFLGAVSLSSHEQSHWSSGTRGECYKQRGGQGAMGPALCACRGRHHTGYVAAAILSGKLGPGQNSRLTLSCFLFPGLSAAAPLDITPAEGGGRPSQSLRAPGSPSLLL